MDILNTVRLESNSQIKINFDGSDISSDAGLLLFKEFLFKIGAVKLIRCMFKTNDTAWFRIHKDDSNLMQVIYQIISSYFEDDCADEFFLRGDSGFASPDLVQRDYNIKAILIHYYLSNAVLVVYDRPYDFRYFM